MEGTISEIRYFGPTWVPRNWAACNGQLLSVASNTALFSLIGTIYGGDGRTTFALPDLRGRVPVGNGAGPGLTVRQNGQRGGQETVTLNILEMPSHNHPANTSSPTISGSSATIKVNTSSSSGNNPSGTYLGPDQAAPIYESSANGTMAADAVQINSLTFNPINTQVGNSGGNQGHYNMQPWLCLNPIICVVGLYPSRS